MSLQKWVAVERDGAGGGDRDREGGVISQEVVRDGLADKAAAEQSPEPAETAGGRNAVGGFEAKGGPVGLGD